MAVENFPVILRSGKPPMILGALFCTMVSLLMAPAIYAGLVTWSVWPMPLVFLGGSLCCLAFGWGACVSIHGYFRPPLLIVGKDGVSLTSLGRVRDIPWRDIAWIGQVGALPRRVVLFLKPNSPSWGKHAGAFRAKDRVILPLFWGGKRRYNSNDLAGLLEQGRHQFAA